jgi:phage shock protein C
MDQGQKLLRPREGALIGGVCAAFARALGIDVTIIRVAWVLTVCLAGTGLLAYVICWIVIPRE